MSDLTFTDEMIVKLIRHSSGDDTVVQAAQVSGLGENNPETDMPRLINALLKQKHGSPFEHNSTTFFISVPIFVVREWQRHRISSFNEMSGRYTELLPKFYTPGPDRKMINNGSDMKPMMAPGSAVHRRIKADADREVSELAWAKYREQLENGISKELARTVLPLNVYTQMYWTVNARSLMNFLSLRVQDFEATYVSFPQREIEMAAEQVEKIFAKLFPYTHKAFVENGRVAP